MGAGSGCHSLALKSMEKEPVAIDISPLSVAVMTEKGVDARLVNLYDENFKEKFDTVLMLMNGSMWTLTPCHSTPSTMIISQNCIFRLSNSNR